MLKLNNTKVFLTDSNIKNYLFEIIRQMGKDNFKPDLVIGLVRGGAAPANYISQFFNIPCYMINKGVEEVASIDNITNVLVIDDINDSGKALTEINNMLFEFEGHVKYATLLSNEASTFTVDYAGKYINKVENPCWIVFPWENWWQVIPENVCDD